VVAKVGSGREIPPRLELQCLKALWILGEANVKDVQTAIAHNRTLAYTTVMTVLDRLVRRGGVERRKVGRLFLYRPTVSREALLRVALNEFVDTYFDGSEQALLQYLSTPRTAAAAAGAEVETALDASLL
jgi:predicted transcriptional regulator